MPTSKEFAEARALFAANLRLRQRYTTLLPVVQTARATVQLRAHQTNYRGDPAQLANAVPLLRTADPPLAAAITRNYRHLLEDLLKGAPDPGLPPLRIDYHSLAHHIRPYLVTAFVNLVVAGRYPLLDLVSSDPVAGRLVYVHTGGPCPHGQWKELLPTISDYLGGHYEITSQTISTITLSRRTPLPNVLPFAPSMLRPDSLFLGIQTDTRAAVHLPFSEMSSGTFLVGASGSGKSNATHLVMQSFLANLHLFEAVYLIDGKEGMTFAPYRKMAPGKLHFLTDEPDVWRLIGKLAVVVRERNAALANMGLDKATNNFIAVLIEEISTYTTKPATDDKAMLKAHGQFIADLASLARKGRSAGLKTLITAQDPTQDQVPTAVRANCQTTIIFRLNIDQHCNAALAGEIVPGADPRKLITGRALLKRDNGTLVTVQLPLAEPGRNP